MRPTTLLHSTGLTSNRAAHCYGSHGSVARSSMRNRVAPARLIHHRHCRCCRNSDQRKPYQRATRCRPRPVIIMCRKTICQIGLAEIDLAHSFCLLPLESWNPNVTDTKYSYRYRNTTHYVVCDACLCKRIGSGVTRVKLVDWG